MDDASLACIFRESTTNAALKLVCVLSAHMLTSKDKGISMNSTCIFAMFSFRAWLALHMNIPDRYSYTILQSSWLTHEYPSNPCHKYWISVTVNTIWITAVFLLFFLIKTVHHKTFHQKFLRRFTLPRIFINLFFASCRINFSITVIFEWVEPCRWQPI